MANWSGNLRFLPISLLSLVITSITIISCTPAPPPNQVITIIDGDSFILRNQDGTERTIDLSHVDAPEREQPYGREAKDYLKTMLFNKTITFAEDNAVMVDGQNLNLLMLQQGFAWHQPENSSALGATFKNQFAYNEAQTEAMNNLAGLWGLEHGLRVPPWVWRKQATERRVSPMQQKRLMEKRRMERQAKAMMEQNADKAQDDKTGDTSGEDQ